MSGDGKTYVVGQRVRATRDLDLDGCTIRRFSLGTITDTDAFGGEAGFPLMQVKLDQPHPALADEDNTIDVFDAETGYPNPWHFEPIPGEE